MPGGDHYGLKIEPRYEDRFTAGSSRGTFLQLGHQPLRTRNTRLRHTGSKRPDDGQRIFAIPDDRPAFNRRPTLCPLDTDSCIRPSAAWKPLYAQWLQSLPEILLSVQAVHDNTDLRMDRKSHRFHTSH